MPTFGSNEAGERLFLSGVGGIYALKVDDKKVVKVLQPPEAVWSEERLQEEIDGFRLRGKTQRVIAKGSKFWAPVYEVSAIRQGTEAESGGGEIIAHPSTIGDPYAQRPVASGAFLTMDRYERSVQSLIDGRVNLLNADLRCLVTAVMKGLLDLHKSNGSLGAGGGRAHGALKATNILLANSADLTTATIHLTDPAADGALDKNSRSADLGDLARIIYELVNLRPYEEGTIARSRDWDALGPNGEDWRKLCIALLDPHAPEAERDLEKLLPKIDRWRRKPKKSKKPMLIGAAAVLVIVGSIALYHVTHPKVVYDAGRWQALNLEYHAWFGDFIKPLYTPKTLNDFRDRPRHPDLPPDIGGIIDKYKEFPRFDPDQIDANASSWKTRFNDPNGDNPLARYGDNPKYTQDGLNMIDEVARALTPERWPALKELAGAADKYEAQANPWAKPAAGIRKVVAAVQPPQVLNTKLPVEDAVKEYSKTPLPERIKKVEDLYASAHDPKTPDTTFFTGIGAVVDTVKQVRAVNDQWTRIENKIKALPGTQSPDAASQIALLSELGKFADGYPAAQATEDVASLQAPLQQLEEMLDQLAAAFPAGRKVDFEELAGDPAAKQPASIESYKAFATATRNYWNITTDPRDAGGWAKQMGTINEMIGVIAESAAPDDAQLPGIRTDYKRLGESIQATEGLKPILKNEKMITDNAATIARQLGELETRSDEHPAYMNQSKFDAFVKTQKEKATDPKQLPAPLAAVSAPVKARWLEAQSAFVATVGKRTLAEFRKTHNADGKKFADLEAFYADLDKTIPEDDKARESLEKAFAAGPDWANALAHRVAADSRVQVLADLLKNAVKDAANPPAPDDATYVNLRRQTLKTYDEDICIKTQQLISDHLTMDAKISALHIDKTEGWRKLWETWPDGKDALLDEAPIKTIRTRVGTLLAAEGQSDYAKIRDGALSDTPEISLASWRALGTAQIAETTPYLADEQAAEKKLAGHLDKLKAADAAEAQAITAEITKAQPARWQRWSDLAASADNIVLALGQAKTFNVEITKQSQPVMFYYEQLLKLKDDAKAHPKEAELKPIAQAFYDLMTKDPALASVSKNSDVASLLERMNKSMSEEQNLSAQGQGPQLAGWDMESPNQDVRIFHSKDKKYTLDFRRMQVEENNVEGKPQKTIFLCTTEMSAGLFIQAMNSTGKLADLDNSKPDASPHWFNVPSGRAYNDGVRSWMIVENEFRLSDKWLEDLGDPKLVGKPFYPAGAKPPDPSADMPIQRISPWSAMYAARLLGCRLPTSDEWQAAYVMFEVPKSGTPLPKDVWNLRGETTPGGKASWSTQQAYADGWNPRGDMPYPDEDIYALQNSGKPAPPAKTNAKPWMAADLAKIAPERITTGTGPYAHSTLWFEPVDKEIIPAGSGASPLIMHHLVGNVGEFVFDSDEITTAIQNNVPSPAAIEQSVSKSLTKMYVIGGSSLSPPEIPFNEKQPVVLTFPPGKRGYSDVGFRLAYTAPKETIVDVLIKAFSDPKLLPGPRK